MALMAVHCYDQRMIAMIAMPVMLMSEAQCALYSVHTHLHTDIICLQPKPSPYRMVSNRVSLAKPTPHSTFYMRTEHSLQPQSSKYKWSKEQIILTTYFGHVFAQSGQWEPETRHWALARASSERLLFTYRMWEYATSMRPQSRWHNTIAKAVRPHRTRLAILELTLS